MIEDVLYINADLFFTVLNKFSLNREAPHDVEGVPSQLNLIFTNNKWKCFFIQNFCSLFPFLWRNVSLNVDDGGDHGDGDGSDHDHDDDNHDGDGHESWVMMVVVITIVTW